MQFAYWFHLLKGFYSHTLNKSTQRVYNTFEKGQTPPSHSPSFSPSLPLPLLTQFSFLFIRKKKRILPGLPGVLLPLPSISAPLISFWFFFPFPSRFWSFHLYYYNLEGNCARDNTERTSSVPCKSSYEPHEAWRHGIITYDEIS